MRVSRGIPQACSFYIKVLGCWVVVLSLQHMSVQNGAFDVRQSDAIDGSKRNV